MWRTSCLLLLALLTCGTAGAEDAPLPWEAGRYEPLWADALPDSGVDLMYDASLSDVENGARLHEALHGLNAGQRLRIGAGRWSMASRTSLNARGTPSAPILVEALDPSSPPLLTRPDARQNVLNVGDRDGARWIVFRRLRFTGGSTLLRIYDGSHIWVHGCELFEGGGEGIVANTHDTTGLFITQNHIHHLTDEDATGEGMYLGNHKGEGRMSRSVIANNHVHHCAGTQGDGIEVKQGSHDNWIVGNRVHDTKGPCITLYGTEGRGINVVERNVCWRSRDNVAQIQGEALVHNNLFMAAGGAGLAVRDHVAPVTKLEVVHNTIISSGTGVRYDSWAGREAMVFSNNAVYSRDGLALDWRARARGGSIEGNVVYGRARGVYLGIRRGRGLEDFVDVNWDATSRDARPSEDSRLLERASATWRLEGDLRGRLRPPNASAGALEPGDAE